MEDYKLVSEIAQRYVLSRGQSDSQAKGSYNAYLRNFVKSSELMSNPSFVAFISDIVLNTPDLRSEFEASKGT